MRPIVLTSLALVLLGIPLLVGVNAIVQGRSTEAGWALLGAIAGAGAAGLFQFGIADADRRQALRMAALSERLRAHQEAYSLWLRMRATQFQQRKDAAAVSAECGSWWATHCVYLTGDAMRAFKRAYEALPFACQLYEQGALQEAKPYWDDVFMAGDILLRGVYLPPLHATDASKPGP